MLEKSVGALARRPSKVEMEFGATLSGDCDLWIVSGKGEAEFKVTLCWEGGGQARFVGQANLGSGVESRDVFNCSLPGQSCNAPPSRERPISHPALRVTPGSSQGKPGDRPGRYLRTAVFRHVVLAR